MTKVSAEDVSAVIVTRGDIDLQPVLDSLIFKDISPGVRVVPDHDGAAA